MANSRYYQFLYSKVPMLTFIEGSVILNASGVVGTVSGNGVAGVTKLATGIYQIQLVENYSALVGADFLIEAGPSGPTVTDGAFVVGTLYQIASLGTTNWTAVGLAAGLAPAIGQSFVATAVGGSGGGTAIAIVAASGVSVQVARNAQTMLTTSASGKGAVINILTLAATSSSVTTLVPTSPTTGSSIRFNFFLRNSSNQF